MLRENLTEFCDSLTKETDFMIKNEQNTKINMNMFFEHRMP